MSLEKTPLGNGDVSSQSKLRVVVRIRPENHTELDGGYRYAVQALDDKVLVFDPKDEGSPDFYHGKRRRGRDILKRKNRDLRYAFDRVFGPDSNNEEVYQETTRDILNGLMDGYNCSVFAYGATGAGKTFTMLGSEGCPGVIFKTMMDLYQQVEAVKSEKICEVAVSYLEVYNEQIKDLLLPSGTLPIREDSQNGVIVAGLSLHKPKDTEELMQMLLVGNKNRTQHPTDANAESSRSHAVFQVFVRQKERSANISASFRIAKMSLIDLAGSERATATTNRGARFREGANINRSLLALGNCINALADCQSKNCYIPYRNSKLTRLLKDSLGGNCRTIMIAAVSPSALNMEDTHNTLKYANRAKNIKSHLKRNVVSIDLHISRYAQICEDLRQEVFELKSKLKLYEDGTVVKKTCVEDVCDDTERFQGEMHTVFQTRMNVRREALEFESSDRDISFKIYRKECILLRLSTLGYSNERTNKVENKLKRAIDSSYSRQSSLKQRKEATASRLTENNKCLDSIEQEIKQASDITKKILAAELRSRHLEIELKDTKRQVKHLKKMGREQDRVVQANDRIILSLIGTLKKQYFLIKGHGLASSDVSGDIDNILDLIEADKGVAWADQSSMADHSSLCDDSSGFSIAQVLDFPVLSCVKTTPKTPIRTKKAVPGGDDCRQTPGSTKSVFCGSAKGVSILPGASAIRVAMTTNTELLSTPLRIISTNNLMQRSVQQSTETSCSKDNKPRNYQLEDIIVDETSSHDKLPSEIDCSPFRKRASLNETFTMDIDKTTESQISNNVQKCSSPRNRKLPGDEGTDVIPSKVRKLSGSETVDPRTGVNIDSGTVVKCKGGNAEGNDVPNPTRNHVARSMTFSSPSSGKMSFADAVKSPAHKNIKQLSHNAPVTPVIFEELTNSLTVEQRSNKKVTFANSPRNKMKDNNCEKSGVVASLRKLGIPSMSDRSTISKPKYMQLTASAAHKQRNHRRTWSNRENTESQPRVRIPAQRVENVVKESSALRPAARTLMSRSKSVSNLSTGKPSWQH